MLCLAATVSNPPESASAGRTWLSSLPDGLIELQQVRNGVGVLEPREAAQRGPLPPAGREIRLDQGALERPERRLDHRRVGSRHRGRRHLAVLHPLVHPLPRAKRRAVRQVESEAREVERRHRPLAVAGEASGAPRAAPRPLRTTGRMRRRTRATGRPRRRRRFVPSSGSSSGATPVAGPYDQVSAPVLCENVSVSRPMR